MCTPDLYRVSAVVVAEKHNLDRFSCEYSYFVEMIDVIMYKIRTFWVMCWHKFGECFWKCLRIERFRHVICGVGDLMTYYIHIFGGELFFKLWKYKFPYFTLNESHKWMVDDAVRHIEMNNSSAVCCILLMYPSYAHAYVLALAHTTQFNLLF